MNTLKIGDGGWFKNVWIPYCDRQCGKLGWKIYHKLDNALWLSVPQTLSGHRINNLLYHRDRERNKLNKKRKVY